MSETDFKLLALRRSCNLLTRQQMETGRTPTTPTVSSVIAGVQCQEAIKLLHGMETIAGKGFVFDGMSMDSYLVEYQRKDSCYSHDTLDEVVSLEQSVHSTTVRQLLALARERLGAAAELELARDVLEKLRCTSCGREQRAFESLGKVKAEKGICPNCGAARDVVTFYKIRGDEAFLDEPLGAIGVPAFDIVIARAGERSVGFEFAGDAKAVLGPLVSDSELEWT
jgi:adenylyltransferase/sulfurtransferase